MERERRQRPPAIELDPRAIRVFRRVADDFGKKYADEFLYPHLRRVLGIEQEDPELIRDAYMTSRGSLLAFYCHYAFARRGKDRD